MKDIKEVEKRRLSIEEKKLEINRERNQKNRENFEMTVRKKFELDNEKVRIVSITFRIKRIYWV